MFIWYAALEKFRHMMCCQQKLYILLGNESVTTKKARSITLVNNETKESDAPTIILLVFNVKVCIPNIRHAVCSFMTVFFISKPNLEHYTRDFFYINFTFCNKFTKKIF